MLRSLANITKSVRPANLYAISTGSMSTEAPSKQDVDDLFAERPHGDTKRRHAYSVNKVELVGGVALDPLLKVAKNDKPFLLFNIITNHSFKQADGTTVDRSERHSVTVFGKQAEILAKTVKRGSRLMVTGRLHYTGGIKDESGGYTPRQTHIIANNVQTIARTPRESHE